MMDLNSKVKILLLGVGGIGVSALARYFLSFNCQVSGYDQKESEMINQLKNEGLSFISELKVNPEDYNLIVYSSAIEENHPFLIQAKSKQVMLRKRGEFLCELLKHQKSLAVIGAHGKTGTTALVYNLLKKMSPKPWLYLGGIDVATQKNYIKGESDGVFIAELDESDGSFVHAQTDIIIITNIDLEHVTHYKSIDDLIEKYKQFLSSQKRNSILIINEDDKILKKVSVEHFSGQRIIFCGKGASSNYRYFQMKQKFSGMSFQIESTLGTFKLKTPLIGSHNALSITLAFASGKELGLKNQEALDSLKTYQGVKRRMEVLKKYKNDSLLISDYGHHPKEIETVLTNLMNVYSSKYSITALIEIHRYSRLNVFFNEYVRAMEIPDSVILTDIYTAGEDGDQDKWFKKFQNEQTIKNLSFISLTSIKELIKKQMNGNKILIYFSAGVLDSLIRNALKETELISC